MDGWDVLITVVVAVAAFLLWLIGTALLIWAERRLVAFMQTRVGPNRLGPFGLLQVLADGGKMFFKEDITPRAVDRAVYVAAPIISAVVAMITFAVIPFGGTFEVTLGGEVRAVALQVWDPEIGLLWTLAMSSLGVYGIALAGWASGSKYPLLGGIRSAAQLISYELSLGLSMAAVFTFAGTLRSSEVVANQADRYFGILPGWHVVPMIPAFVIFSLAAVAEAQRPPFDLPEAEGELVGGFHTEYSGAKFAMFQLAEFMAVVTQSAIIVTLFFGGPLPIIPSPFGDATFLTALWGTAAFITKTVVFIFGFIWLRASLPRLRYDRLMDLGWKVMLPISLAWVFATGFAVLFQDAADRGRVIQVVLAVLVTAIAIYLVAPLFAPRAAEADDGGGGGGLEPDPDDPDGDGGVLAQPDPADAELVDVTATPAEREREPVGATRLASPSEP